MLRNNLIIFNSKTLVLNNYFNEEERKKIELRKTNTYYNKIINLKKVKNDNKCETNLNLNTLI
jgi:hypothetical protein